MPNKNYRPEIDGLRAIAVFSVIFFHAGIKVFSGGFVGVDIFFVISGYLITLILISENEKKSFSLMQFYERRARRILPVLILLMFTCIPFAWALMNPVELRQFLMSLLSVSTFSSNIFFMLKTAYFDLPSEKNPLLHTWTLAVEEQYYIVFPILFLAIWKFNRKLLLVFICIVAGASLGLAQYSLSKYEAISFYLLPTRAWELMIGSLLAYFVSTSSINLSKSFSQVGEFIGIMLIFYSIFFFDKNTPNPSIYLLIPTLGTALILLFSSKHTLVGTLLSYKPLVGFGLISYSLYLWHQPIFAFNRIKLPNEQSEIQFIFLIFLTVILSYVSWKFIETPFRNSERVKVKTLLYISTISSSFFIFLGLFAFYTPDVSIFAKLQKKSGDVYSLDLKKLESESRSITKIYAQDDFKSSFTTTKTRILVIGDSMADDFITAAKLSKKITSNFELKKIVYDDLCFDESNTNQDCKDARDNFATSILLERNASIKNKLVIISSSHFNHVYGFANEIGSISPSDYQRLGLLYSKQKHMNTAISNVRAEEYAQKQEVKYIDGYSLYCEHASFCPLINKNGELLIFDTAHKTPAGLEYYRDKLENWFNSRQFE
jgi:peptidoglycan/LPS O-acetylase OafA/YrhL